MECLKDFRTEVSVSSASITKQATSKEDEKQCNYDFFQANKMEMTTEENEAFSSPKEDQMSGAKLNLENNAPNKHKFQMLAKITNQDLSVMQYVFENFSQGTLDKSSFILLMMEVLKNKGPSSDAILKGCIEVYDFIDIDKKLSISFSDFSSFFMTQESDLANLSHASTHFKSAQVEDSSIHSNWISKIYYLSTFDCICILEENQKNVKIYNAQTLELQQELAPKSIISDLCFIPNRFCLVMIGSDKKLYLYTITQNQAEFHSSFETPESQINIIYCQTKETLFSYGLSAKIFGWKVEKIFSKSFQKIISEKDAYIYALDSTTPISSQKNISCMISIDSLGLLATGSNDAYVRLYEIRELKKTPRTLIGHYKGIRKISFSENYQYLVSCSYDNDIIIWNPIVGQALTKLTGHEASILDIAMLPENSYIISCDAKGCTKIWDANTLLLMEDKYPETISNVKCVLFVPKYRRIVYAGKKLVAYEYARLLDKKLTEDSPIVCAIVSLKNMEIFVATKTSVSVWSLEEGVQVRSLGNIMKAEITCMVIDEDQRRLYIADQSGHLKLYDALTGSLLKVLTPHQKEITTLLYCKDERMIISSSWDKNIRTHLESNLLSKADLRNGVLKNLYNSHENEVLCGDYSHRSGLLVTGSKDGQIRIWNFQTSRLETEIQMFNSDISHLKFLDPYPILAASDNEGNICLYSTEPHPNPYRCLVNWKNMFNLQKFSAITSIIFEVFTNVHSKMEESMLYIGDRMGYIRVFSLESLLKHSEISVIPRSFKEKRRVSNKIEDIDFQARGLNEDKVKLQKNNFEISGKSGPVKQVLQWKAHQEAINQITLLHATDPLALMTVSVDKMLKFWNLKGENIANLYQGVSFNEHWNLKIKENYLDNSIMKFFKKFKADFETKYLSSLTRIQKLIISFTNSYEYEDMAQIKNDDIFRNFADLENTVAQTLGQTTVPTRSLLKTKKKK